MKTESNCIFIKFMYRLLHTIERAMRERTQFEKKRENMQ